MLVSKTGHFSLLVGLLAGCQGQLKTAPDVQLRHQHDQARQQQEKLLNAEQVTVSAHRTQVAAGPALNQLTLVVRNAKGQPAAPDSLVQRARKLAHLVVADLANPQEYQAVAVTLTEETQHFLSSSSNSRTITYSVASLR